MSIYTLVLKNIFNIPILCFIIGVLLSLFRVAFSFPKLINNFLTLYILLCIGIKGGGPLIEHAGNSAHLFFTLLTLLISWGLLQPFLSFFFLKTSTRLDVNTAAAVAASFGSVSVMTFITAIAFLDRLNIPYEGLMIAALAIMELPAIISGVCIGKLFDKEQSAHPTSQLGVALRGSLLNRAILAILSGFVVGIFMYLSGMEGAKTAILIPFQTALCLFLFNMGLRVGQSRANFRSFSLSLTLFGIYMPLLGGAIGLLFSFILGLDPGTGTLIAVLSASASYIAVPAAMRIALPQAQEAVYLPLSLGIAFPFNIIVGIPLYYRLASIFLK